MSTQAYEIYLEEKLSKQEQALSDSRAAYKEALNKLEKQAAELKAAHEGAAQWRVRAEDAEAKYKGLVAFTNNLEKEFFEIKQQQMTTQNERFELQKLRNENRVLNERLGEQSSKHLEEVRKQEQNLANQAATIKNYSSSMCDLEKENAELCEKLYKAQMGRSPLSKQEVEEFFRAVYWTDDSTEKALHLLAKAVGLVDP